MSFYSDEDETHYHKKIFKRGDYRQNLMLYYAVLL